ncbi:hypothetical protein BDI4_430063 [Burkholderia diffusa]|nr:hypothetical protein BDI4_430063 [Burkholderia diffusa]
MTLRPPAGTRDANIGQASHPPSFFLVNNHKKHHFAHAGLSAECLHSHSRNDTSVAASRTSRRQPWQWKQPQSIRWSSEPGRPVWP